MSSPSPHWTAGTPDSSWDELQTAHGAHFLQHSAWAAFQAAQGKRLFYAASDGWSWLAMLEPNRFGSRLYCPFGPTAGSIAKLAAALEVLTRCAKDAGAMFVRVDPQGPFATADLSALKLHKSPRDIQPRYTLVLDLTQDDDALYKAMSSTNRRLYRQSDQRGFAYVASSDPADIDLFLDMIHDVAARSQIQVHQDAYYRQMAATLFPLGAARLAMVLHGGQPAASCITFETGSTTYYAHAGTAAALRTVQPGVPLLGHMIFEAKAAGKKHFDFYGIAPPDQPEHKLRGVTRFKQSFGGEVVDQHGTWELPVAVVRHMAYRVLRRVGG